MVGRGAYGRRRGIPQGYARPGTKGTAAAGYPPEEARAANATTIRMANVRGTDLHGRMSPLVYLYISRVRNSCTVHLSSLN